MQPGGFGDAKQTFDNVRLDGDQEDFEFATRSCAQNLVIPNDLLQWERHILLRFVLDYLGHFSGINRRQLDEFRKDMKARSANVDEFRFDAFFGTNLR